MGRRIGTYIVAAAIGTFAAGNAWAQGATLTQQQDPQSAAQQGRDEAKSRQALVQARETLAEITKLPEASQLQGQSRTEVSQLIENFNSLLAAEANWYEHYQTVMQNVHNIIGPVTSDESTAGSTTGTSGTTGSTGSTTGIAGTAGSASAEVPTSVRTKLVQFRQQLMAFGRAAGAPDPTGGVSSAASGATGSTAATTGSTATGSTTTGTTGSTTTGTTGSTAAYGSGSTAGETVQQHVDAISDILQQATGGRAGSGSTTGTSGSAGTTGSSSTGGTMSATGSVTLTRDQVERIQSHLQRIRELSRQR